MGKVKIGVYRKGFNQAQAQRARLLAVGRAFVAVQLHVVEVVARGRGLHIGQVSIDKNAYFANAAGQAAHNGRIEHVAHAAVRLFVENKPQKIGVQVGNGQEVASLAHAADFDSHGMGDLARKLPGRGR